jgi:23S rRNA (guanine745-N1)-methyltransferase
MERSLYCVHHHCFDLAKSGYVNLLPSDQKRTKIPGDNKQMVAARTDFLNRGYYQPLVDGLDALLRNFSGGRVLDAGCGEGYYTDALFQLWKARGFPLQIAGVDISKFALDRAAKRNPEIAFAVASIFHLPVAAESCDLLLNLFAPYCREEFLRVLKPDGLYCMVIPGTYHLWELKQAIYDTPYPNAVKDFSLDGWSLAGHESVHAEILLTSPEDIRCLFAMTPYSYKTSRSGTARLEKLTQLRTQIAFELLLYRKAPK